MSLPLHTLMEPLVDLLQNAFDNIGVPCFARIITGHELLYGERNRRRPRKAIGKISIITFLSLHQYLLMSPTKP
jgi:hypothetical protein